MTTNDYATGYGIYESMKTAPIKEIDFNNLNSLNGDWIIYCGSDTVDEWIKLINKYEIKSN
jgi:hypothetical protein